MSMQEQIDNTAQQLVNDYLHDADTWRYVQTLDSWEAYQAGKRDGARIANDEMRESHLTMIFTLFISGMAGGIMCAILILFIRWLTD